MVFSSLYTVESPKAGSINLHMVINLYMALGAFYVHSSLLNCTWSINLYVALGVFYVHLSVVRLEGKTKHLLEQDAKSPNVSLCY